MIRCQRIAVGLTLLLLAGCEKPGAAPPAGSVAKTNAAVPVAAWPPTNAQPRLQTINLFVGPETVVTEIAMSRVEVSTGMMFRKTMAENEGMLFVFPTPHRTSFYMKNTTVPLTAAYLDSDGTILELHDLQPLNETPVEAATENIQYVLEMPQGWFKRHSVTLGAILTTQYGRFKETFRFRQE